jgi:hypothetical protein
MSYHLTIIKICRILTRPRRLSISDKYATAMAEHAHQDAGTRKRRDKSVTATEVSALQDVATKRLNGVQSSHL